MDNQNQPDNTYSNRDKRMTRIAMSILVTMLLIALSLKTYNNIRSSRQNTKPEETSKVETISSNQIWMGIYLGMSVSNLRANTDPDPKAKKGSMVDIAKNRYNIYTMSRIISNNTFEFWIYSNQLVYTYVYCSKPLATSFSEFMKDNPEYSLHTCNDEYAYYVTPFQCKLERGKPLYAFIRKEDGRFLIEWFNSDLKDAFMKQHSQMTLDQTFFK